MKTRIIFLLLAFIGCLSVYSAPKKELKSDGVFISSQLDQLPYVLDMVADVQPMYVIDLKPIMYSIPDDAKALRAIISKRYVPYMPRSGITRCSIC